MMGFRRTVAKGATEQRLREEWYAAKAALDENKDGAALMFRRAHDALASYIWQRACKDVEEDRRKHPKKMRNQPYQGTQGTGRILP